MKFTLKKPKAALFDLDGTLFDTDPANILSYRDAFAEYGFELTEECWREKCAGRSFRDFQPVIFPCAEADAERIHSIKKARYPLYLDKCRPNETLFGTAEILRREMPLCVVTTASRKNTLELLGHFGVTGMFSLLVTQEDVSRAKPDPECYFYAFGKLSVKPCETIIFEDSLSGIEAARRSGGNVFISEMLLPIGDME